ncbi:MAG: hypothetical protein NTV85_28645 [Hyphomicrobiales bacterium]|nr:hypothetical protein [Hyphomicrobiales bacterium]
MTRTLLAYVIGLVLTAVAVFGAGIVVGLALAGTVAASRAAPESIPAVSRPVAGSVTLDDLAQRGQPDSHPGAQPAARGRVTPSPSPTRTRPAATTKPRTAQHREPDAILRGVASTYGPGWDGWLALPQGPGVRVRICGAGGCVVRTSTDAGPSLAMQRRGRVADLDVAAFELVCGVPWTRGLCRVALEYLR